jgi:hypothetical protein
MMLSLQNNGGVMFGCSLPPDTAAQRDFQIPFNTGRKIRKSCAKDAKKKIQI